MIKKLVMKLDSCIHCSYMLRGYAGMSCMKKKNKRIRNKIKIPKWCPLEEM